MLDKVKRYKWKMQDTRGRLDYIAKDLLNVDPTYQRDVGESDAKIIRLASEWSWQACGVIIVCQRDERLFVVDGQHRVLAAKKRDDITKLPCIVFQSLGAHEEAKAFLKTNKDRKFVNSHQSFKAEITSGDPTAVFVDLLLKKHGLVPSKGGAGRNQFRPLGTLKQCAASSQVRAERVLAAALKIVGQDGVTNEILKGLRFIDEKLDDPELLDRIAKDLQKKGLSTVDKSIKDAKTFLNSGGPRSCAEGILSCYNKGKRNRVEL